jgi:DNA-directed RNA polymerase III subunit RPC8
MFILVRCFPVSGVTEGFMILTVVQTKVADLVQITPSDFKKSSIDAIHDNINAKYANKVNLIIRNVAITMIANLIQVIQKIGLCICLWDVLWASEGLIGHGTGLVNVNGEPDPGRSRYAGVRRG